MGLPPAGARTVRWRAVTEFAEMIDELARSPTGSRMSKRPPQRPVSRNARLSIREDALVLNTNAIRAGRTVISMICTELRMRF